MPVTATHLHAIDVTAETFTAEVVDRSHSVPVVIDFWAEWCQPCRMLGPVLEKLAGEYQGRFVLAKVNTEAAPEVASGFAVRSIPAVFAIRDGQVVDSFVGVLPETALRTWLDRIMPTPAELLVREGSTLEVSDLDSAQAKFLEASALAPALASAKIGLARVALAQGRTDESRTILEQLERRGYLEPEAETLKAQLVLQGRTGGGDLELLLAEHQANLDDRQTQLRLAEALASANCHAEVLALSLDLVEVDRRGTGEAARKLMLAVFQLLPADSPLVNEYRRKLSVAL